MGQVGSVWRAVHRESGEEFAIKVIDKAVKNIHHPTAMEDIRKELGAMQRLGDGEHCVRLFEVFDSGDEVALVLELMRGGDLFERIKYEQNRSGGAGIPEVEVKQMIRQTVLGMKALHAKRIIHRDLKPENILLDSSAGQSVVAKIADLGLAKAFPEGTVNRTDKGEAETTVPGALERTRSQVGSPGYAAPELLQGMEYSYEVDVWSLGVITYCALSGCNPFPTDMQPATVERVISGTYSFPAAFGWDRRSLESQDFIRSMLKVNPEERPSLDALLAHPWLQVETIKAADSVPSEHSTQSVVEGCSQQRLNTTSMRTWLEMRTPGVDRDSTPAHPARTAQCH